MLSLLKPLGETTMTNIYIDQGIIEDCHNDQHVILTLRTKIHDAIRDAEKYRDAGAMAYNGSLLLEVIDKLDDILAEVIQPVETLVDEGERYHDANTNAARV
jgi:hypothetical protein